MKSLQLWSFAITAGLSIVGSVSSRAIAATFVSTELVLSVDVSGSIDDDEFALQRSSYANAFRDPSITNLISRLDNGIAVTFQYWAAQPSNTLQWFHVTDVSSAAIFANAVASAPRPFDGLTNIAGALDNARLSILTNDFVSSRRVIDISSDGRQNTVRNVSSRNPSVDDLCAPRIRRSFFRVSVSNDDLAASCLTPVRNARNTAVGAGITINGLPILTDIDGLTGYFQTNVIGGPNAFVQPAAGFQDFQQALTTKIRREIAAAPTPVPVPQPAPAPPPPAPTPTPVPAPAAPAPPPPPVATPTPPPPAPAPPAPAPAPPPPPVATPTPTPVPEPIPAPEPAPPPVVPPSPPEPENGPDITSVPPEQDHASVPEPGTATALGLFGLLAWRLRRTRS